MELKHFIKQTVEQIVEGAALAQESIRDRGGTVNPSNMYFIKDGSRSYYEHGMPQEVVFDVGLTSTDRSGSSEGIGVFLGSVTLGKKNNAGVENVVVTKVRFSIPLVLPLGDDMTKRGGQHGA